MHIRWFLFGFLVMAVGFGDVQAISRNRPRRSIADQSSAAATELDPMPTIEVRADKVGPQLFPIGLYQALTGSSKADKRIISEQVSPRRLFDFVTDPSLIITILHSLEVAYWTFPFGFLLMPVINFFRVPNKRSAKLKTSTLPLGLSGPLSGLRSSQVAVAPRNRRRRSAVPEMSPIARLVLAERLAEIETALWSANQQQKRTFRTVQRKHEQNRHQRLRRNVLSPTRPYF